MSSVKSQLQSKEESFEKSRGDNVCSQLYIWAYTHFQKCFQDYASKNVETVSQFD